MFDGKAFGEEMVGIVKTYVDRATAPLVDRIAELEKRQPEKGDAGPPGRDGADGKDGKDGIDGAPGEKGADGRDGVDGATGADGKDGRDGIDGAPGEKGADGRDGVDGAAGADGKDGLSVKGMLVDRAGHLRCVMTDGTDYDLGPVVGKDGEAGKDGRDGLDGADGKDGADGLGFDDLSFAHDGERGFVLRFVKGERTKEFPFTIPVTIDRGVWREGSYRKGDATTWAGSLWIAQKDTDAKPDSGDGWRLAVKRGRDGKNGEPAKA